MPSAPSTSAANCPHDLGPGTTVCLRCRQERRDAARARQQQLFAISGVAAMALLGLYVMGASAANAWRATARGDTVRVATRASVVVSSVNGGGEVKLQGEAAGAAAAPAAAGVPAASSVSLASAGPAAGAVASSAPAPATTGVAAVSPAPIALSVPDGRTDLTASLVAERGGDSVTVDFDAPATRTRRRDKFEAVVRQTLPMVFGAPMDSVLRAIPAGGIAGGADLLTELPTRGVHLPVGQGWTLDLWPGTRPGQDGPLVVKYRARLRQTAAH